MEPAPEPVAEPDQEQVPTGEVEGTEIVDTAAGGEPEVTDPEPEGPEVQ